MAPGPPSPSASSTLLPFLGGRSRRGSLASITSRGEVDKTALAQALDNIHESASKSETLTSFHDFDGGQQRESTKEMVSNGVSGIYNRLRQSVAYGSSGKDVKARPKSAASKESGDTASIQSSLAPSRTSSGLKNGRKSGTDVTPLPNPDVTPLPAVASFASSQVDDQQPESSASDHVEANDSASSNHTGEVGGSHDNVRRAMYEQASAMVNENGSAPQTSAHALIDQNLQPSDRTRSHRNSAFSDDSERNTKTVRLSGRANDIPRVTLDGPAFSLDAGLSQDRKGSESHQPPQRPPMQRIGLSHLPGYDPSRASSTTDGGDNPSPSGTWATVARQPGLDPSPNLNTALQRRRTGLKSQLPATHSSVTHIPVHLKRRVVSKEFWMKDENAKDCFSCGQSFSTFRRKHHCRTCGQIFDARCTTLVAGHPFGQPGTLRLCKPCEAMIYGSDDDSTVFSDDEEDVARGSVVRRGTGTTDDDVSGQIDGAAYSVTSGPFEVTTPSIGIPASRRNREAKRRSAVIEFDAQPLLARPSSSHSLVSLGRRPRSSSHRRLNSRYQITRGLRSSTEDRVPFQPEPAANPERSVSLPAFHNDNVIDPDLADFVSDEGSDDDEAPGILTRMEQGASPGERERLGLGSLSHFANKKGRSRLGEKGSTASRLRGVREEDPGSPAARNLAKLRKRNPSMSQVNLSHPLPRHSRSNQVTRSMEKDDLDHEASLSERSFHVSGVRNSAMLSVSSDPVVELNPASLEHVQRLLAQLLHDMNIEYAPAWESALIPVLLACTNDVKPDVERGDDMDIRHYIKLKKVPGGKPHDTSYVSGVVFSKNLALKSMTRSIQDPRIAIVTFSIEYARHQAHFLSLDPVIAQEREYLENLVGRIAALQPHVLLVQRNVSGLALRLLEQAGITVAYNIKESVLAAVARCTQTTMIKSVDKLAIDPSHLGHCRSFDVKTYTFHGVRKSYIYLSGCAPELGCTLVLRGTDTKTLRKIKRITEFMCYVVYNLKLETFFMRDESVFIPSSMRDQVMLSHDTSPEQATLTAAQTGEIPSKYEQMEADCRSRILSASPFVEFMQPYLLTQLREQEQKLAKHQMLRDQYAAADEESNDEEINKENPNALDNFELVKPEMVNNPASRDQPKTVREYLHAVHDAQFDKTMHTYETQRKLWESFVAGSDGLFDPVSHQSIVVLHSTVSSITSAPCVGPEVLSMSFYAGYGNVEQDREEDCTLGQYIEELCLASNSTCEACNKKTIDHHRQYVHGHGQLSISIQRQPAKPREFHDRIMMWSICRICNEETSPTQMSYEAWKYSFAKYLELSFWSRPLHLKNTICQHDIHKDFLRCFSFNDLIVRVQYDPIEIYDVVVPRATITWKVETDLTVKNEQFSNFMGRLNAFTESVRKRLESINIDTLEEKKASEAHDLLRELHRRADEDHQDLQEKLRDKYSDSRYYELIPLNRALRFMDEKALAWDEAFNNFERDYFPSETDIRKLATLQLKSMFLESQPPPSVPASEVSDSEEGTELTSLPHQSPMVHHGDKDMTGDQAHGVMFSTVEEHRASHDSGSGFNDPKYGELGEAIGSSLTRSILPRGERESAVERKDVKHLDLALASRSPDDMSTEGTFIPATRQVSTETLTVHGDVSIDESFAAQPIPLSSGLLERIEQIRSTPQEPVESRIPRLADLKKRDASPQPPPPLLRAKSQPANVPYHMDGLSPESSINGVINGRRQQTPETHPVDKRLSERLGLSRAASKIGKVTPAFTPRSIPAKPEEAKSNRVSALAKHFEQMSREFEKERLKERRQRAMRSRQARANPLASSRPTVEVYRNATEAVGERAMEPPNGASLDRAPPVSSHPTIQAKDHAEGQDEDIPGPSSDEPMGSTDHALAPRDQSSQFDEGDASDTDGHTTRSRDTSDLVASDSMSSTLVSPSFPMDLETHPELSIPEYKKNAWFKYLADFWSKRSASGWSPLEYPLHGTEHVFEDSDIIVREDEPSSVIALALACADYQVKVKEFRSHPSNKGAKNIKTNPQASIGGEVGPSADAQQRAIEASLLGDTGTHMKYSFAHGPVKASCKIFYAESFDALRRRCGVSERFVESLSRCLKFDSKGGKTKSLFLKTLDNRFIIKSLQEVELKAFTKFAPDYFNFMGHTLFRGVPSVIAKMFGLFQVIIKNPASGMDFSYYLLVMENLFYERNPNRRFDLKGSMRNRKIESTGQPDEVLLDENLVETIFESPLFVREHARKLMQASVWNDTMFLSKQNVMDYSLMAGFDDDAKELVVGIIDCIRTYTWDKKLESWIKDRGRNKPTITSPKDYRNRFRVSMMQYVLEAPCPMDDKSIGSRYGWRSTVAASSDPPNTWSTLGGAN